MPLLLSHLLLFFLHVKHGRACELLLRHARADYNRDIVPGYLDLSQFLTYPGEVVGSPAEAVSKAQEIEVMSNEQQTYLRKNRGQFTASEDNLLLRGVVSSAINYQKRNCQKCAQQ